LEINGKGIESDGWAKLHVIVDINEIRALTFSITDEHIHDSREALNLVNRIRDKISKLYGDKAYDSKSIYNALCGKAITPASEEELFHTFKGFSLQGKNSKRNKKNIRE